MECPFCDHSGLGAEVKSCPGCKADLSAYHSLDAIELSIKKQKKITLLFIILFILALLGCVVIYMLKDQTAAPLVDDQKIAQYESTIQSLQAEKLELNATITSLQEENAGLKNGKPATATVGEETNKQADPKAIKHIIKPGESLFMIAREYLGNGDLYPKIASDNGIENPDIIIAGQEITIYK